jgi:hypothetical protein
MCGKGAPIPLRANTRFDAAVAAGDHLLDFIDRPIYLRFVKSHLGVPEAVNEGIL